VTLRAAGPADAPAAREMHRRCSAATLTRRYPGPADEADRYLGHLLDARHGHSLAAVAPDGSLVGLGHLLRDGDEAEVALLVEDAWQRHGVGTAVLRELVGLAVREGREAVYAVTDTANTAMIATMRATGLPLEQWPEEHGTLVLSASLAVPHGLSPARLRG
jgi:GNAT superfamily N-acetyltransferase